MGTWAAGNFGNDSALDYVGDLIDQLTNTIAGCFAEGIDLSDGESKLVPSVAIIRILSEHCGAAPPRPNEIELWRSKYLAVYDQEIDDYGPDPDYKVERRNVIDSTFSELINLSAKFWKP